MTPYAHITSSTVYTRDGGPIYYHGQHELTALSLERAVKSINIILKFYNYEEEWLLLSKYLLIMVLRFDWMLYSNLGNEHYDAGHVKCSRGPQVLHPWFIPSLSLSCYRSHTRKNHIVEVWVRIHWCFQSNKVVVTKQTHRRDFPINSLARPCAVSVDSKSPMAWRNITAFLAAPHLHVPSSRVTQYFQIFEKLNQLS